MLEMALDNGGAPTENDIWQTRLQLRNLVSQHPGAIIEGRSCT